MEKKMSALAVRRGLGQLLEEVYYRGDQIIIERAGRPMAVMIPVDQFESWVRQRENFFGKIEQVWERNQNAEPGEVEEEVREAVGEVRRAQAGEPTAER
jgi:prevent-host-death family protein